MLVIEPDGSRANVCERCGAAVPPCLRYCTACAVLILPRVRREESDHAE